MKIVVTGGTGQIGSAILARWPAAISLRRDDLDLNSNPRLIRDRILELRPTAVVHCAAMTAVDLAEVQIAEAMRINGMATLAIALACQELGARFVTFSGELVERAAAHPRSEHLGAADPISGFGWSKAMAEAIVAGTTGLVIRTSCVFGGAPRGFLHSVLARLRRGEVAEVVDDQFVRPTYSPDLAAAVDRLLDVIRPGAPIETPLFVQNSGDPISWSTFAAEAADLAGCDRNLVIPVSAARYRDKTEKERHRQGISVPVAPRPASLVFSLDPAERLGVRMRDWREALAEHLSAPPNVPRESQRQSPMRG